MKDYLDLDGWDKGKQVGLISCPVGVGKTYFALKELPEILDVPREETLMVTSRKIIEQQTLDRYEDCCGEYREMEFGDDRILLTTFHKIGAEYRGLGKAPDFRLVIIDEWHSVFAENNFASQLIYFQKAFEEWLSNPRTIIVAMTATPTLFEKFVNKCCFEKLQWLYDKVPSVPVKKITKKIPPRFHVRQTIVVQNMTMKSVLRNYPSSEENKQLVFASGAISNLYKQASLSDKYTWLCSATSKSKVNGKNACELMDIDEWNAVQDGAFPKGKERLYLSSAFREGLNIEEQNAGQVFIENYTDIGILQSLGRVRHDTDSLVICVNKYSIYPIRKKVRNALDLLRQGSFEEYYKVQQEQEADDYDSRKVPVLVYKVDNEYLFNYYALYYWLYCEYSLTCATQKENERVTDFYGAALPSRDEYFESIIGDYTRSIEYNSVPYIRENVEETNDMKIQAFDWSEWRGKALYGDIAKQFSKELNLYTPNRHRMSLSGIYKSYPQLFKSKQREFVDGKRPWVYRLL